MPRNALSKTEVPMLKEIKSLKKSLMLNEIKKLVTSRQDPTQLGYENELKESLNSKENYQQWKAFDNADCNSSKWKNLAA